MASSSASSHSDLVQPGWSSLSGKVLEGGFELQEMLAADEQEARFKVRVLGDRDLDCVALFYQVSASVAAEEVEIWELTRSLRHPNVSAPLGAGHLNLDNLSAAYVVVRRADESLDSVLAERALTVEETGEVLTSVAKALEVLHINGLAYGCLSPSRVLAVADSIKIPSECARALGRPPGLRVLAPAYLAPESHGENVTVAADIWSLGGTLFEALTQKPWTEDSREETGDLPEPFATIALRCLHREAESRASLGEVMALYRGEIKPLPRVRAAATVPTTSLILPESSLENEIAPARVQEFEPVAHGSPASDEGIVAKEANIVTAEPDAPAARDRDRLPVTPERVAQNNREPDPAVVRQEISPVDSLSAARPTPVLTRSNGEPAGETTGSRPSLRLDEAIGADSRRRLQRTAETQEAGINLWLWAGIALVVVLGMIWALRPKASAVKTVPRPTNLASNSHPAAANPPAPAKPSSAGNAWETRTLQPDGSASKTMPPASGNANAVETKPAAPVPGKSRAKSAGDKPVVSTPSATPAKGGDVWRVIAFTYSHRNDAEKKARAINSAHSDLHAEVFSPGGGSPFLIALGGRMTRDDAAQLRRRAVSVGLPHDSYIQNYKH